MTDTTTSESAPEGHPPLPPRDHDAVLMGWGEPRFTDAMARFQRAIDLQEVPNDWIDLCAESMTGYLRKEDSLTTTDNFPWRCGYRFTLPLGAEIVLLVAPRNDDGSAYRHCALYVKAKEEPLPRELDIFFYRLCKLVEVPA